MDFLENEYDVYIRMNKAEENATGLFVVGYNDFKTVKSITSYSSRPFRTVHFVFSGKGVYHLNGKTYEISGGEMFFTPANVPICYYPDEKDPWRYAWFSFATETLSQYIPLLDLGTDCPVRALHHPEEVFDIIDGAFGKAPDEYVPAFSFTSAFMQILALEARQMQSDTDVKNTYIQDIKKCIENNYTSEEFTVDMLCDILHLSHSYICRIFRASEGVTIINYIESLRMQYAADLLVNSDMSVSSISGKVGYRDPLHFMKQFKRRYGVTAVQYRNGITE